MKRKTEIVYFAPDGTQGSVAKRLVSFIGAGFNVTSFTFGRDRPATITLPPTHIELGIVWSDRFFLQLVRAAASLPAFWRSRKALRSADVFFARMLHMALIAVLLRMFFNRGARLYYEVCDIRRGMVEPGARGKVARWLERRVLAASECVVVMSRAFVTEYFEKIQGYDGQYFLLESKTYSPQMTDLRKSREAARKNIRRPLAVAWCGNLDDEELWEAIKVAARSDPSDVFFHLHGYILIDERRFNEDIAAFPNISYAGPFDNRTDLFDIYSTVDAVLGIDLTSRNGNSWWLVPCAFYEAGAFGKPLICTAGTETARRVTELGCGYVLQEPIRDLLTEWVRNFDARQHERIVDHILSLDPKIFAGEDQLRDFAQEIISQCMPAP